MVLTPTERTQRARLAAHTLHASGKTNTGPAREAFLERFINEVDPNRELPEEERLKRADHAMRAHMARLAFKSAKARRKAGAK